MSFVDELLSHRTVAVWSPQRHQVKLRTSVALVVAVALYATVTTLVSDPTSSCQSPNCSNF